MNHVVTMGEGNTPLISAVSTSSPVFFKLENVNPSGSYKDRFIAAELTHVLSRGIRACVATSSGNTGSALAAYCARYKVRCIILVNDSIPSGKLIQMKAHGATVIRIRQFTTSPVVTEQVFTQLREFSGADRAVLVVSAFRYCPVGMQGVQAISHEISRQLPEVEHVFVPVGSGGLYAATVQGFAETQSKPKVHAVQPEGCPTILNAVRAGTDIAQPVESSTKISGLSVPFDIDGTFALRLIRQGAGEAIGVSDNEILDAQQTLLRQEGIYCEPAGAAAFAGYRRAVKNGQLHEDERCVCLVTGSGAKDPMSLERIATQSESPLVEANDILNTLGHLVDHS